MFTNQTYIRKSGVITLGIMLLVILLVASYFIFRNESALQKRNNTSAAQALLVDDPEKSFTDLEGNTISVADHFGKIIVVMSWASWCPQCTTDLQELGALARDYQDRGVIVLAVNRAEDRYTAERYLATVTVPAELQVMLDPSDYYFAHSAGYAMPETIVFRPDGAIATQVHGELRKDDVRAVLDDLLAQ